jgi:two-component system sensor histidine kinase KdpD
VSTTGQRLIFRYVAATALVCGISLVYPRLIHVNHITIALTFFLAVVVSAARSGMGVALYVAVLASLAFSYCFFPPVGSLANSDPQDWVAIFVFLGTAIIASHLLHTRRQKAEIASRRSQELEQLYRFAQRLIASNRAADFIPKVPQHMVDAFQLRDAALFVARKRRDLPVWNLFP